MPMLLALLKPFWPLIWRAVAVAAAVLFVWWAWVHFIKDPYIAEGVAQEHVKTVAAVAANAAFSADLLALKSKYELQSTKVQELADREAKAKAEVAAARAELKKNEGKSRTEIQRLRAVAAQPAAVSKEADCEKARQLIDATAASLLRG